MRYCTLDDLKLVMPVLTLTQLSNDDPAATDLDEVVVERGVQAACELIDGKLRARYITPLAEVPTLVRDIAVSLTRHWLYARRPEGHDFPDAVVRTYKEALSLLDEIQQGKLTLGLSTGQNAPEPGEIKVRRRPPLFTNELLSKY